MKVIKMIILNKFTIIVFLLFAIALEGKTSFSKVEAPVLYGVVKSNGNIKSGFDTLLVNYEKPYTPWGTMNLHFQVVTDINGNFKFNLPKYDKPIKVEILVRVDGKLKKLSSFFIESHDSLKVDIQKENYGVSAVFSGIGSKKYSLAVSFEKLEKEWNEKEEALQLNVPENFAAKLLQFNNLTNQMEEKRLLIIANSGLKPDMKKMVAYEYGAFFSDWSLRLYDCYTRVYNKDDRLRKLIKNNYLNNLSRLTFQTDPLMGNCPVFLAKLAGVEMRNLLMENDADSVRLENYYNTITTKYSGLIRERLIADLFFGYTGFNGETKWNVLVLDSLMLDGEKYITVPFVKSRFSNARRLHKGEKIFSTTFIDQYGSEISTQSFRGKVVFIDMWGTGCSACAIFHQKFHKDFYPILKENKDFVYLSLSTDKTKEKWQKAIHTGRYTSNEYLNVYFGNLGINHPFAKYYDIQGAPFLLIIDRDGKIFSSIFKSDENVKVMILEALRQKVNVYSDKK